GMRHVVYLTVATGIGAGLVLDGRLYRGTVGTAGEIGHTTIDENGPVCTCGNRGCLQVLAGAPALLRMLNAQAHDGLTVEKMLDRALQGDFACQRVVADAGQQIGLAVTNLSNVLDPELVIVGGVMSRAGDLLLDPMREVVRRGAIRSALDAVPIVPGVLG